MTARTSFLVLLCGLVAALALATGTAAASGLDQLHAFLEGTQGAQGTFRQVVVKKDRSASQTTSGTFAFRRPGKFRWAYDKPFDQLIVGDGEKAVSYTHLTLPTILRV